MKPTNGMPGFAEMPGFAWFFEGLDEYLDRMSLKQTQPRRIIVQIFLGMNTHVDAEELHRRVREEGHDIGLATIYRTLNLLTEAGLVEQKSFQDGKSVFEIATPDSHHDHLMCTECRRMVEFEDHEIEALQTKIAIKYGMELRSHRLDLFGRCVDLAACAVRKMAIKY
jgi:Fur family transcriptional regulator, ferric uptake regulator